MKWMIVYTILAMCLLWGCGNHDGKNDPIETQNNPPEAFHLVGITDNTIEVDVTPTVFDNKIWEIGGVDQINGFKNDIWVSADAGHWTMVPPQPAFPIRLTHTAAAFDDKLWVIAGIATNGGFSTNDVWAMY